MAALAYAPAGPMMRDYDHARLVRDREYQETPIGAEMARYLEELGYASGSQNTAETYEIALRRLAHRLDDYASLEELAVPETTELLRRFLTAEWGEAASSTRHTRQASVRGFFKWAYDTGRMSTNPAAALRTVRVKNAERLAYTHDIILRLVQAQPLRDQCALQFLALLGLRKNELRVLRVGEVDLVRNVVTVHRKGGKVQILPLGFRELREDLYLHIVGDGREPNEYLLYPRNEKARPMDPASLHRWFKRCLERAELPSTIKIHELRHTAADTFHRHHGNLVLTQDLLGHESPATTRRYLHPSRDDLAAAMRNLELSWRDG